MYIHWILSSCTVYIIVYSLDRVLPSWLGNYLRIQEVLLLHGGFTLHKLKKFHAKCGISTPKSRFNEWALSDHFCLLNRDIH